MSCKCTFSLKWLILLRIIFWPFLSVNRIKCNFANFRIYDRLNFSHPSVFIYILVLLFCSPFQLKSGLIFCPWIPDRPPTFFGKENMAETTISLEICSQLLVFWDSQIENPSWCDWVWVTQMARPIGTDQTFSYSPCAYLLSTSVRNSR